jgi:hypothetical protein
MKALNFSSKGIKIKNKMIQDAPVVTGHIRLSSHMIFTKYTTMKRTKKGNRSIFHLAHLQY